MDGEVWKPVVGYEGLYEVSDLGRVRGLRKNRVLKPSLARGYHHYKLYLKGKDGKLALGHRLVMAAFVGPSNLDVNHIDNNPSNNALTNLEYCTAQQNMDHSKRSGRMGPNHKRGADHYATKFSDDDIAGIRHVMANGTRGTQRRLALALGVAPITISRITKRKVWKHV